LRGAEGGRFLAAGYGLRSRLPRWPCPGAPCSHAGKNGGQRRGGMVRTAWGGKHAGNGTRRQPSCVWTSSAFLSPYGLSENINRDRKVFAWISKPNVPIGVSPRPSSPKLGPAYRSFQYGLWVDRIACQDRSADPAYWRPATAHAANGGPMTLEQLRVLSPSPSDSTPRRPRGP
jgi:hypothetical protein